MAEWVNRVESLFVTQNYTQEGIIVVKGLVLGNSKAVVIDDYLPFYKGTATLTFDH